MMWGSLYDEVVNDLCATVFLLTNLQASTIYTNSLLLNRVILLFTFELS